MSIQIGDWVRYYQNGSMIIAVVQYVKDVSWYEDDIYTDKGTANKRHILEVRPPVKEPPSDSAQYSSDKT